jgi:hypothetical protein
MLETISWISLTITLDLGEPRQVLDVVMSGRGDWPFLSTAA